MSSPRSVQEAPKTLQVEPKRHPRGSKLSPRGLQELQVEPKKASKKPRRAAKGQSNNTSTAQKAKTLIFDDPTTLFEGPDRSGRATGGQVGDHFGCMEAKFVCIKILITVQMASKMYPNALQVALQVLQVRLGLHLVLQTGFHGLQDGLRSSNLASIQPK